MNEYMVTLRALKTKKVRQITIKESNIGLALIKAAFSTVIISTPAEEVISIFLIESENN